MSARINRRAVLGAAAAIPVAALPSSSLAADRSAWDAAVAQFRVRQERADAANKEHQRRTQAFRAAETPRPETICATDYPNLAEIVDGSTATGVIQYSHVELAHDLAVDLHGRHAKHHPYFREARWALAARRRVDRDNARLSRAIGLKKSREASDAADFEELECIDEVLLPCSVPDLDTLVEKIELLKDHTEGEELVDAMLVDLRRLAGTAS